MGDVQIVETSLRDGNQSLWSALGVDTAKTLTIAPVMDRVGFKAIDFTTSTHMRSGNYHSPVHKCQVKGMEKRNRLYSICSVADKQADISSIVFLTFEAYDS